MNTSSKHYLAITAGLVLALLVNIPSTLQAGEKSDCGTAVVPVAGQLDFSIIPPAFTPDYVTTDEEGNSQVRKMPLAGAFSVSGKDITVEGTVTAEYNADLDPSFTGPIYGKTAIVGTVKGRQATLFKGRFFGHTAGLVSSGMVILEGRGPYAGMTLFLSFQHGDPNTTVHLLSGYLVDSHAD